MAEKIYDEDGFDENGFDKDGYNAYGELDPRRDEFNMEKEDIIHLSKSPHGRRFIWRVLSFCKIWDDFEPGLSEDHMREQVGRRRVGLYIMGIINEADPQILLNIMNENHIKEKERENARRNYGKL